jgi:uncharacterized membrane protein YfcA
VIGSLTGLFGVGGSSVATPLLSVLGVPGLLAVASPLPATIPAALGAATPYVRSGEARPRAAAWTVLGGVPAAILGSYLSAVIGGPKLLILSGVVLVVVGIRMTRPIAPAQRESGAERRRNRPLLVLTAAGVGLFTGVLANGGGFLLVPMYVLLFGLRMREASGTSLLVITILAIPTLIVHWSLGHIDWVVAGAFALGAVPAGFFSARLAHRLAGPTLRRAFGWFLATCGVVFVILRIRSL